MSENRFLGNISASSFRNLLPKSVSTKKKLSSSRFKHKMNSENVAPIDPNVQISDPPLLPTSSILKKTVLKTIDSDVSTELTRSVAQEQTSEAPDPPVKVVARIRPANGIESGTQAVRKASDTSVCVADRKFNFDMVFGSNSNQEDVFQSVGAPLVKDALAGYNTSLLAYGQTGSGKTYTMWGPPSSIVEVPSPNGLQGIVPRIFQTLFSSIQKEQENSEGKQINYQCRCSFLEIYDEHIGDLLDPTQRNLKIMDDPRVGFYVENITEEYVSTYEDVSQMLIKGLSSRKVGSTSINSKSSRSHIVFTCVIESWCKESSSTCFGSSKMSRMSLVDLAGFDKNIPDDAGKQLVKEGKYVKKSTSLLGHLVNVLSERSQSRKLEDVSYSSSTLTHLMRESLGGNAKLSVICAISPENKHNSETVSTLRFGKRVKLTPNEPLVNEITEDDVNGLSDQIRQLKEELIRARSSASISVGSNYGSFRGPNVRESLNQLRVSLNRSLILPDIDNEREEEEVHINEDDIKELQLQIDNLRGSRGHNSNSLKYSSGESEHYLSCSEESEGEEINSDEILEETLDDADQEMETMQPEYCSSISIGPSRHSADLPGPVLSESPKFRNMQRKSLIISGEDNIQSSSKSSELPSLPQKQDLVQSSLRSSRIFPGPTESLAASLHRGLEIIDYHQRNSASNKSLVSFSFEHLAVNPSPMSNGKANASIQTSSEEGQSSPFVATTFLCPKCKTKATSSSVVKDSTGTWMVSMEGTSTDQDSEKVLFQLLLGGWLSNTAGIGFTPHVIMIAVGEDITTKIMSFSQQGPRSICILSATGVISTVTLRQPSTSGGTVTYEGRFEILCLSGSFLVNESGGSRGRIGSLSVSLASPDGRVIGGGVGGVLVAASPIQVIVGSFLCSSSKAKKRAAESVQSAGTSDLQTTDNSVNPADALSNQNLAPSSSMGVWPSSRQIDLQTGHIDIDLMRG